MMDAKTVSTKALFFVFAVAAITLTLLIGQARAADTIKIGHICSVTGWAGMFGSPQRDAMLAIVEDINKKGGILGKQVEAVIEDDRSSPTTAVIAATKLIRDHKVSVLIGASTSDSTQAIAPLADQEKVPFIVTAPVVMPFKKWVYPAGPGDVKMAAHTFELAVKSLGAKRIALLHDTALYGTQGAKIIQRDISKFPGTSLVAEEKYEVSDTSMIPQLTKIKAAKPDVLILYGAGAPAAVVAKNYKQLGMTVPVVAAGGCAAPDFLKVAGGIADESNWLIAVLRISIAETLPPNDPYRRDIYEPAKKIFQNKYKDAKALTVFHISAFDAMHMATLALKAAGKDDRAAIRDALDHVKFTGLIGYIQPEPDDHQGGNVDTSILARFKNGQFVPYTGK